MHESAPVSGDDLVNAAALIAAATVMASEPTEAVGERAAGEGRAAQIVILAREIVEHWAKGR